MAPAELTGPDQEPSDREESAQSGFRSNLAWKTTSNDILQIGRLDELPTELIANEYRVRQRWGDRPSHEDYLKRFRRHAPELQVALRAN